MSSCVVLSHSKASSFVEDVKNVSITERPSLGQAALELRATPQLLFLGTGLQRPSHTWVRVQPDFKQRRLIIETLFYSKRARLRFASSETEWFFFKIWALRPVLEKLRRIYLIDSYASTLVRAQSGSFNYWNILYILRKRDSLEFCFKDRALISTFFFLPVSRNR
jgi:hypothetical protein